MNVLITCAGRRSYLVDYFRKAVIPYGGKVITANSKPYASGFLAGDVRYIVPKIDNPDYIQRLLEITRKEDIGLVVSLFDIDLPALASARDKFKRLGAELAISDPHVVEIAGDKWKMHEFLVQQNLPTPRTWINLSEVADALAAKHTKFPLIVKPRWGMGSIGVIKVHTLSELNQAVMTCKQRIQETYLQMMTLHGDDADIVIQECASGSEYGADILNDLQGSHLCTVVKRKISQKPEGAEFAVTVNDDALHDICARLAAALRHRGNIDVDMIKSPDGKAQLIEINARFGGGYPFSHLAGAQFPRALIQMVRGETPDPGKIAYGVVGMLEIQPCIVPSTTLDDFPI